MGAPAIIHSPREQWLARRRELVTASDVAAILGEDERRGPLAVYASKVGDAETEETEAMARGRDFEDAIARAYERQTGRQVRALGEFEIQIHRDLAWLGATLDRVTASDCESESGMVFTDDPVPLQIKMALGSAAEWRDEPPTAYLCQVNIEAACYGSSWAALAGLVGPGPLAVSDHQRDDEFLALAIPQLEDFRGHVLRKDPASCGAGCPMVADAKPGTSAAVRRLWNTVGRGTVPLGQDALELVRAWDFAHLRLKVYEAEAEKAENALRALLGDAAFGALPDGRYVRRSHRSRGGYEVGPAEWVQLDVWAPKVRFRG